MQFGGGCAPAAESTSAPVQPPPSSPVGGQGPPPTKKEYDECRIQVGQTRTHTGARRQCHQMLTSYSSLICTQGSECLFCTLDSSHDIGCHSSKYKWCVCVSRCACLTVRPSRRCSRPRSRWLRCASTCRWTATRPRARTSPCCRPTPGRCTPSWTWRSPSKSSVSAALPPRSLNHPQVLFKCAVKLFY